jgi:Polyketide cyclase / dehydrase and lipid transport
VARAPLSEVTETAVVAAPVERIWAVVDDTGRYAEWVVGVIEVTAHHGTATVGRTYSEHNRTVGPLTTRSTWTVREIEPLRLRVDTGTGFAPMHDMTNTFTFRPLTLDGVDATEMTYRVTYRPGLGAVGRLIDRLQQPGLRAAFQASMRRLETIAISEAELPGPER